MGKGVRVGVGEGFVCVGVGLGVGVGRGVLVGRGVGCGVGGGRGVMVGWAARVAAFCALRVACRSGVTVGVGCGVGLGVGFGVGAGTEGGGSSVPVSRIIDSIAVATVMRVMADIPANTGALWAAIQGLTELIPGLSDLAGLPRCATAFWMMAAGLGFRRLGELAVLVPQ